jgi:uncharacterized protein (TIRG00374 family)
MPMKKIISLAVSLLLLGLIYYKIDVSNILRVFALSSPTLLGLSLAMVVPLAMATSWRLCQLMPGSQPLGFWEANRLTLMASVLNMVLPSKMGDVAKAAFMAERGHLRGSLAVSLVVFEKACDMASLLAWCAFGLALYPQKDGLFWIMTAAVAGGFLLLALLIGSASFASFFFQTAARFLPPGIAGKLHTLNQSWREMHGYFWESHSKLARVALTSLAIWFLHLLQIWLFTLALRTEVPFLTSIALSPLALLAGLLPLTFAGVGTRDAALVYFFAPYMNAATAAALGLLCTMRYLLPAAAGLPFIGGSINNLVRRP